MIGLFSEAYLKIHSKAFCLATIRLQEMNLEEIEVRLRSSSAIGNDIETLQRTIVISHAVFFKVLDLS